MSTKKTKKRRVKKVESGELFEINEAIRINNVTLRRWKHLANDKFVKAEIERKENAILSLELEIESLRESQIIAPEKVKLVEAKQKELHIRAAKISNQNTISRFRELFERMKELHASLQDRGSPETGETT